MNTETTGGSEGTQDTMTASTDIVIQEMRGIETRDMMGDTTGKGPGQRILDTGGTRSRGGLRLRGGGRMRAV